MWDLITNLDIEAIIKIAVGIFGGGTMTWLFLFPKVKKIGTSCIKLKSMLIAFWDKWYDRIISILKTMGPEFIRDVQNILYVVDDILEYTADVAKKIPFLKRYSADLRGLLTTSLIKRLSRAVKYGDGGLSKTEIEALVESNPAVKDAQKVLKGMS